MYILRREREHLLLSFLFSSLKEHKNNICIFFLRKMELSGKPLELRDVINLNTFVENNEFLDKEIVELEKLYSYSKNILETEVSSGKEKNEIRRIGSAPQGGNKRRNMLFISQQISNLTALRRLKLEILNHKAVLKRDELDRNAKILTQLLKEQKIDSNETSPEKILNYLVNQLNISLPPTLPSNNFNENDIDRELELVLQKEISGKSLEHDNSAPVSEKPLINKFYNSNRERLVLDTEAGKIYLVTEDYDIIRDIAEEELEIVQIDSDYVDNLTSTIIELI